MQNQSRMTFHNFGLIQFIWLVQFFEFLAYITVALVYKTRMSKLYVCLE